MLFLRNPGNGGEPGDIRNLFFSFIFSGETLFNHVQFKYYHVILKWRQHIQYTIRIYRSERFNDGSNV